MKQENNQAVSSVSIDDIRSFFQEFPDALQMHPELLSLIQLQQNSDVASLLEKQVAQLRKEIQHHKQRETQLIQLARSNENIIDNLSEITSMLIGFNSVADFAIRFPEKLKDTFQIDEVAFKTERGLLADSEQKGTYQSALERLANNRSSCDNKLPSAIMRLFFSETIQSAALIPLLTEEATDSQPIGILALGSADSTRYTPELGTVHLDRLGLMAGICLNRLQSS